MVKPAIATSVIVRRMSRSSPLGYRMFPILRCVSVWIALSPLLASAQQRDDPTFTVGTATAQRGMTATGTIAVPPGSDSALAIPVAVLRGERPGPVVAFV